MGIAGFWTTWDSDIDETYVNIQMLLETAQLNVNSHYK